MSATNEDCAYALRTACDFLRKSSPKPLATCMEMMASMHDIDLPDHALATALQHLVACGPNDQTLSSLTLTVQAWDHDPTPEWAAGTEHHTDERRRVILDKLGLNTTQQELINSRVRRFSPLQMPIIIATKHEPWYDKRKRRINDFYWNHYVNQLLPPKGKWTDNAVSVLNTSVEDVVARLSDPTREEIYPVKGLVVGYVQSGKTAHFSGLIAKAADAGYRMIIVLAGTLDILRMQTQRRIDKEIVGQELLGSEEYGRDPDWNDFVTHGGRPSMVGSFDWERLTNRDDDYTVLKRHLSALEFRAHDKSLPFNHPDNLDAAPARIAVIKKVPARLNKLCDDLEALRELRSKLEHVPTLVIDDESDQASINTAQRTDADDKAVRTKTNAAIGRLLSLLPRAQYVGYTATPFANVFIDPEDAEDLFPKDFIVSLPRPHGYMGVADFYDFSETFPSGDFRGNSNAFVRPVEGENSDPNNLTKAIDSFVLSGAIKLFRQSKDPDTYRFRHHTMLVHHSATRVVHEADRLVVEDIFKNGARYQRAEGEKALEHLFSTDYQPVSEVRANGAPCPSTFAQLKPFISKCLTQICSDKSVRVVNGDNHDDTPNFDEVPVWAILVGGTKLSRGYTVEGLTISYYRRPTGAGDTLLQMGRWFGFREGYRDLVRLFIGRKEKRGKTQLDLYEAFGAVCRDEEALRADLAKYANEGLTPYQVPPLVRQHLPELPVTSRNKMFNAEIRSIDFAGESTEKTSAPRDTNARKENRAAAGALIDSTEWSGPKQASFVNTEGKRRSFKFRFAKANGSAVYAFLKNYNWADNRDSIRLELEYIDRKLKDGSLKDWVILLPEVKARTEPDFASALNEIPVISRTRVSDFRFGVYSDPAHKEAASYLAEVSTLENGADGLDELRSGKQAVLILYFVTEEGFDDLSVGFAIQYPGKKIKNPITWSVRDKRGGAVITAS